MNAVALLELGFALALPCLAVVETSTAPRFGGGRGRRGLRSSTASTLNVSPLGESDD